MREEVRIERRPTHHREDLARLRVHDDGRGCRGMDGREPVVNGLFRRCLQILVNCQYEVVARHRHLATEALDRLARDIHLDLVAAVLAAHILIIDFLQAELADDIAGLITVRLFLLELFVVDLAHIAERMRALLLEHIVANRRVLDHDARIEFLLLLDDGDDIGRNICLDADGIETAVTGDFRLDVLHRHVHERGKALDDLFLDGRRERQQRHGKPWTVCHEQLAVPVIKRAARRDRGDDADAVAVRQPRIVLPLIDLQIPRAPDKHSDDEHHEDTEHAEPAVEAVVAISFDQRTSLLFSRMNKEPLTSMHHSAVPMVYFPSCAAHSLTCRVSLCTG